MRRRLATTVTTLAALCLTTVASASGAGAAPSGTGESHRNSPVCDAASPGTARCDAIRHDRLDRNGKPAPAPRTPAGYGAADLQAAYALDGAVGAGATVAVVDAYDDPSAEADLGVYRDQYGLPACTTTGGCFRKVNQTGGSTPPVADAGWAQEISLDLDMVSATCPDCHILLVEAASPSFADLAAAVDYAAGVPGVAAISNSYGGQDTASSAAYDHPGIAITASTGDSGYGVQSPASYPGVIAVGGTSLRRSSTARGWTETAWSGAGSGCSDLNARPDWQTAATGCPTGKANADVSAVADPNTGVAVYDSYAYRGTRGWLVFGGTSASAPIVAGIYAMTPAAQRSAAWTWGHASALNDVTSGSNGTCTTAVWCTAGVGWDGPTGLGTPKGTAGF